MKKNMFIAVVLSVLVLVGASFLQELLYPSASSSHSAAKHTLSAVPEETRIQSAHGGAADTQETTQPAAHPSGQVLVFPESETEERVERTYVVRTPLVQVTFTNRGGDILSYQLREHYAAQRREYVEMVEQARPDHRAFSLALGDEYAPNVNALFQVKQEIDARGVHSIGFYRSVATQHADGTRTPFVLAKRYVFYPDNYMFELHVSLSADVLEEREDSQQGAKVRAVAETNAGPATTVLARANGFDFGAASYTLRTPPEIGPERNAADKYEFRTFMVGAGGKAKTYALKGDGREQVDTPVSWASVSGKYFALIVLPNDADSLKRLVLSAPQAETAVQHHIAFVRRAVAQPAVADVYRVYIGPCAEQYLSAYNVASRNPYGLERTYIDAVAVSGGILYPLEVLLKWLLRLFYTLIPNWGVAIILVTIAIKVLFFPLTKRSFIAMQKMQELQPHMQRIQERYKGNTQKIHEEMAKLYREAQYNPLSGCLPTLVQMPIIFAMYRLFNNYFEFRGAMFIPYWIPDLSLADSVWTLPFALPVTQWTQMRMLPVLYVVSQIMFSKLTQVPHTEQQKTSMTIMTYVMPLFFFFFFYDAPSGLLVYWTAMNGVTLVQQLVMKRTANKNKT